MFFWLSCFAAGLSLCLFVWVCMRPVVVQRERARDYSSRLVLNLLWPWVLALAPICARFISWRSRQSLHRRIHIAGLDLNWKPEHVVAMQWLACLVPLVCVPVGASIYAGLDVAHALMAGLAAGAICMAWPRSWLHQTGRLRQEQMLREFPFLLDMTTLCVEAGLNLQGALQQAAMNGPEGPLRSELRHALADMRAGMSRSQALSDLAQRTDLAAVRSLVTALGQADQLGMSLGPLLRSQSEQRRAERFLRAEKLALEAPVKMLFPMVFCIFPCTFLVIGFPIAVKLLQVEF